MWALNWFRSGEQQVIETTTTIVEAPKAIAVKNTTTAKASSSTVKAIAQNNIPAAKNNSKTVKAETP